MRHMSTAMANPAGNTTTKTTSKALDTESDMGLGADATIASQR